MAAQFVRDGFVVRGPRAGDGAAIASLWRELWEAHEGWGGYASATDDRVYDRLAVRLDEDAILRADQPVLGRHVHLLATEAGVVRGQVEGWFERHGVLTTTPFTCEVRSLIVAREARGRGIGRVLLDALAGVSGNLARGGASVLVAEVLEPNPAHPFYAGLGFGTISWNASIGTAGPTPEGRPSRIVARAAAPEDALAISLLEASLSARRRAAGDPRFDPPRAVDATLVGHVAAHLARTAREPNEPVDLVATSGRGQVRGAACVAVSSLDPPFVPSRRGVVGRFALDPASDPEPIVLALVGAAKRIAAAREAPRMEITDLTAPGTPIHDAVMAAGATRWSRLVQRPVPPGTRSAWKWR